MNRCVIDANIGLALVVPLACSGRVLELMSWWHRRQAQLSIPGL